MALLSHIRKSKGGSESLLGTMAKAAAPRDSNLRIGVEGEVPGEELQRIAEDKARAARWASRRRLQRNQEIPVVTTAVQVPIGPPENIVLQDLLVRRAALLQELNFLDTAIAVNRKTHTR